MPVIALVGNKGGAGKTTLSFNLVAGLSKKKTAIVVDADPQGSSTQWGTFCDDVSVESKSESLSEQIDQLVQDYEYVLIDCPPSIASSETEQALTLCDLCVIPVQPSPVDLWATVHTEEAVKKAQQTNPSLKALLVINQLEGRTTLSRLVRDALSEIQLPVANTAIRRRAVYRNSALEGKSIYQMGQKSKDAVAELEQLLQEVLKQ